MSWFLYTIKYKPREVSHHYVNEPCFIYRTKQSHKTVCYFPLKNKKEKKYVLLTNLRWIDHI